MEEGAGGSGAAVRHLTNLGVGAVGVGLGGGLLYGVPTSFRTPQRAAFSAAKFFAAGYAGSPDTRKTSEPLARAGSLD